MQGLLNCEVIYGLLAKSADHLFLIMAYLLSCFVYWKINKQNLTHQNIENYSKTSQNTTVIPIFTDIS